MSCCGAFVMPVDLTARKPPSAEPRRLTGWHVLFGMIAFFAVIAAVNATMMVLAIQTMPGAEVKSAYEASQRFNGELAAAEAQAGRGWQVEVLVSGLARQGALEIHARDRHGVVLDGLEARARIAHPVDSRLDRHLVLESLGQGRYRAVTEPLGAGQWGVSVELSEAGERRFVSRRRLVLKD